MALTVKKRRYADARLAGATKKEAAIAAGCPEKTASQAASRYEKDPDVIAAISRTVRIREPDYQVDANPHIPAKSDDPKTYLTQVMNDLEADPKQRLDAAKTLMPYVYGRVPEAGKKDAKGKAAKDVAQGPKFGAGKAPKLKSVK